MDTSLARGSIAITLGLLCFAPGAFARDLSFEDRVAAQAAIERVYFSHQTGDTRSFESAVPRVALETKVRTYLKQSAALETYWQRPVTAEMLRTELSRMAQGSRMPERLREIYAALGNDPVVIQECLARPALVDRLVRREVAGDFDAWWSGVAPTIDEQAVHAVAQPSSLGEDETHLAGSCSADDTWDSSTLRELPQRRHDHSAVWTGSVMIVWGGDTPYHFGTTIGQGHRYDPATDTWTMISKVNAPEPRSAHSAVWTGTQMIVWGGTLDAYPSDIYTQTGGRYDPLTDTWTAMSTTGAPEGRKRHVTVWTGTQMLVWGGMVESSGPTKYLQTGARYNPVTNTWTQISVTGAPTKRTDAVAVWTGGKMVVWGGERAGPTLLNDGGQYDPALNTWTATSLTGAPVARDRAQAVWTGSVMVVWGNDAAGRYDPSSDTWAPVSAVGAPASRVYHTAIWTGGEMIVWGGISSGSTLNTGWRYDPVGDTWTALPASGAPPAADHHTAIWTGTEMIVWGGTGITTDVGTGGRYRPSSNTWTLTSASTVPPDAATDGAIWTGSLLLSWGAGTGVRYDPATDTWGSISSVNAPTGGNVSLVWTGSEMIAWSTNSDTGGRYNPATDQWVPISGVNAPTFVRTAVWTGSEMIVWNGTDGWRYRPSTDTWTTMSNFAAPSGTIDFSTVWTGSEMIVWGGRITFSVADGARYSPDTDTWTHTTISGAPQSREKHAAVWTGTEMIVWGGAHSQSGSGSVQLSTGARYNPATNTWTAISTTGAPAPRHSHTAVWTGSAMIVWGGSDSGLDLTNLNTGGRYDPSSDSWAPTSLVNAPDGRWGHQALWTEVGMVVVGQNGEGGIYSFGQSLDLDGDGYSHCTGDCDDLSAAVHPGAAEVCDGFDNDCNGLADDGIAPPAAVQAVSVATSVASWAPTPGAAGYDAVEGSLGTLRATGGDFTTATSACLADDTTATSAPWTSTPAPGEGIWALVRAVNCVGTAGSYDEGSASQQGSRDAEIAASGAACP